MSDALTSGVIYLHNIFIICLTFVIAYNLYFIFTNTTWFFGITELNPFTGIPIAPITIYIICYILYRICIYIVLILLVLLFWVFVFWMLIIIFVPFIVIFPIPIFPFIFILPLKPLMLLLIPPFKTLTDLGTLPLTYRILSRLFNGQIFYNFISYFLYPTGNDIGNYLYFNVNQIVQEAFGYDIDTYFKPKPNDNNYNNDDNNDYNDNNDDDEYFKNKEKDDYSGKTKEMNDIETNDNPDDVSKYNEYKNTPNIKTGMKKIEEETTLCVNMLQKFKPYNSSYTSDMQINSENSFTPYNECYIKAIKSYLKTSII